MRLSLVGIVVSAFLAAMPSSAQTMDTDDAARLSDMTVRISAFSGKPVPRFESLKYPAVHGRTGPSLDYPIAWRYERQGLPVLVVKESREWLMVRDPSGDEVWMHERTLGGQPSVMVYGDDLVDLKAQPKADGRVVARIEPGAIANLIDCEGAFCQIYLERRKGWAPRANLWGAPGGSAEPVTLPEVVLSSAELESE